MKLSSDRNYFIARDDCPHIVLYAPKDSYAEVYAKENNIKFEPIGE